MSASVPWSVKGIDRKARETAKDLARRSGMTLGEWLNTVIEYQGEGKVTPLPQNATLNEAIERLTSRVEAVETRSSLAVTGMDQSVRGLAARIDVSGSGDVADALKALESSLGQIAAQVYANEAAQKASLAEIRDELARVARTVDAVSTDGVENRLAEMEGHIARAEQRSSKAIDGIGQQVLLMADTVQRQVEGIDQRTTAAVDRVERDIARVSDQLEGRLSQADQAQAAALEKLGAEIERITVRLAERIGHGEARASAAGEGAEPSPFAGRIHQSEVRTAALLDEARETIEGRLEALAPQAAPDANDFSPRSFFREEAPESHTAPEAPATAADADPIEAELRRAFAITAEDAGDDDFVQPAGKAIDPFALDDGEDPFAADDDEFEPAAKAEASPLAPVIYPSEDPARTDYAFAPQDFEIVGDDAAQAAVEEDSPVSLDEARSFETVEFDAADPFSVDDEFETGSEVEAAAEAEVETEQHRETAEDETRAEADPFAAAAASDPDTFISTEQFSHDETVDDEAVSFEPHAFDKTDSDPFGAEDASEAEAFEPGPFGRADQHFEDSVVEPLAEDDHAQPVAAEVETETEDHAEDLPQEPAEPISYLERARLAAQKANSDDGKRGKGGFSLGAFGFGNRRRGGAKLKSGLLMSTAVLICLGSGLAGAAMLAPLLKETGSKLSDKGQPAAPQAAMMTNPQPIKPQATAAAPLVAPAEEAKPVDPSASMIYAESLSLLSAKDKKGVEMLQKAATLGYPQAELQLGHLYETGYPGLQSDLVLARKWTEKAAEAGLPSAMHNLAMLVYNGEGGVKSPTLAAQWFRQAAELGQVDSQFNLGLLYENGKGVQANPAEAYKWFVLASRGGDAGSRAEARAAAQRVRPLISAEAQAAAERAAMAYGASQQAAAQ